MYLSPLVLAELDYLIGTKIGPDAAQAALDHIMGKIDVRRYEVPPIGGELRTAHALMTKYQRLGIGLTATMNAALAATFRTNVMFTLDRRHFRTVRPLTGQANLRLLPHDQSPDDSL